MTIERCATPSPHQYGHTLVQELIDQQEAGALLAEANQMMQSLREKPVRISLVDQTISGFRAETLNNQIWVKKNLPREMQRGSTLFELTNIIHLPRFRQIKQDLKAGKFATAEEYARSMEKVEYDGIARCVDIFQKINAQKKTKWVHHVFLPHAKSLSKGFDHYYRALLKDTHKEHHRKMWHLHQPA